MSSDIAAASQPPSYLDSAFFSRELVLEQNGSSFSRHLSAYWAFGDSHAFGGHTTLQSFAATSTKLSDESGMLCAYATQQVYVWHPPLKSTLDGDIKK